MPLPIIPLALVALGGAAWLLQKNASRIVQPDAPTAPDPDAISTGGTWTLPPAGEPYADMIGTAASQHSIDERLLGRLLQQESGFRDDVVEGRELSSAGAIGIAQFLPSTAADLNVDPLNVEQSIDGAAKYLRQLYNRFGNWPCALGAYNWGQGNVSRKGLANAPQETKKYVADIMTDVYGSQSYIA